MFFACLSKQTAQKNASHPSLAPLRRQVMRTLLKGCSMVIAGCLVHIALEVSRLAILRECEPLSKHMHEQD